MASILQDTHGRTIKSVRISITDRCNLRCKYCMPEEGIEWQEKSNILTFEEITKIIKMLSQFGVNNIRLTGGEPTIREDYIELIKMIRKEAPNSKISLTTNGTRLDEDAKELKAAGLNRINISLDTLNPHKFKEITRRDSFDKVLSGIDKAVKVGIEKIKVNAVAIRDFNTSTEELTRFIELASKYDIEIRFIEYMPFTGMGWKQGTFIPSSDLRESINKIVPIHKIPLSNSSSTSRTWKIEGKPGKIGFISSVSESFCHSCDRIRITSEGNLRPCLHNSKEYPLRDLLRKGASDNEILKVIKQGLSEKWKEHPDFLSLTYLPPFDDREMIRIGG